MQLLVTLFTVLFLFSFSLNSFSQVPNWSKEKGAFFGDLIKLPNADADKAIEIKDSIAGPYNVSLGYGLKKELPSSNLDHGIYGENNSTWFKFKASYDTILVFDIIPFDSLDDYDFVLFKYSAETKPKQIQFARIRECWSVCNSKSGMTGLSQYASATKINAGPGPAYVASINIKKDEIYYLVVNFSEEYVKNHEQSNGFMIYFYNNSPTRKPITLNNIYFETGKAILLKESFFELDKLVGTLLSSQAVIEIRGHTDNVGNEKDNQKLSEERAKAVVDYLITKKIDKKRLYSKGLGSTQPVAPNTTEEGRQKNRRIEFVKMMY